MAALVWDVVGERFYESGIDRGVLYVDDVGYPWSGIVSVDEKASGGEQRAYYLDGVMYLQRSTKETFGMTLEAYYSPEPFDECDGTVEVVPGMLATGQRRKSFGFSYRTKVANDISGSDFGYKIHIVYGALAKPTDRDHRTVNADPEAPTLVWDILTKPVLVPGALRSAHIIIDSTRAPEHLLSTLEAILYGDISTDARLPEPSEIASLFDTTPFSVTDLGDGEFLISGTDVTVFETSPGEFTITGTYVSTIDEDTSFISDGA